MRSQVPLLCNACISSIIACFHLECAKTPLAFFGIEIENKEERQE